MNRHCKRIGSMVALLLSSPTIAQVSTDCIGDSHFVHCDSTDEGAAAAARAQTGREIGQAVAVMREKSLRAKLGKMIAAGDCQGAATYALQKGRFDLVQGLKQFCGNGGAQVQNVAPLAAPAGAVARPMSPYEEGRAAAQAALARNGG